jgi:hypothetical protein
MDGKRMSKQSALEKHFAFLVGTIGKQEFGIPMPECEFRFCERRFRFDFCWPDKKLAVECDGGTWSKKGRHTTGSGYERDCVKLNLAVLHGYKVLRFTTSMLKNDGMHCLELISKVGGWNDQD